MAAIKIKQGNEWVKIPNIGIVPTVEDPSSEAAAVIVSIINGDGITQEKYNVLNSLLTDKDTTVVVVNDPSFELNSVSPTDISFRIIKDSESITVFCNIPYYMYNGSYIYGFMLYPDLTIELINNYNYEFLNKDGDETVLSRFGMMTYTDSDTLELVSLNTELHFRTGGDGTKFLSNDGTYKKISAKDVQAPYFARVWNLDNATPNAERWEGDIEFGRNLQHELGLGCYLVQNDHSRRKLDPKDHYKFATGEPAKLDGSMGHYQWGWGKPFYLAFWTEGNMSYEAISLSPIKGKYNYYIPVGSMSAAGFATMERSTDRLVSYINDDPTYRGGNNTVAWDGTYRTLCGKAVSNIRTELARAAARKNGSGWLCGTMRHSCVVATLFDIIFGTHNVQADYNPNKDSDGLYQGGFGAGVTNFNGTAWDNYNNNMPFIPMSAGIELGDSCGISNYEVVGSDGSAVYTARIPVFFGLKNMYGYLWRLQDDHFGKANGNTAFTLVAAPSIYGDWTIGNETGMNSYSTSATRTNGSSIKSVSYNNLELFPTEIDATSTTYYCDFLQNNSGMNTGYKLILRGGGANNGYGCGMFAVVLNFDITDNASYIGTSLCEANEDWLLDPIYAN